MPSSSGPHLPPILMLCYFRSDSQIFALQNYRFVQLLKLLKNSLDLVTLLRKTHRRGWQGAAAPPQLCRTLFYSGNFSERTIGKSGSFSNCSPDPFDLSGRKCVPPKFEVFLHPWKKTPYLKSIWRGEGSQKQIYLGNDLLFEMDAHKNTP